MSKPSSWQRKLQELTDENNPGNHGKTVQNPLFQNRSQSTLMRASSPPSDSRKIASWSSSAQRTSSGIPIVCWSSSDWYSGSFNPW
eukprot:m.208785 g.208785  ORF g.208785 m.208785 type:complete len:86 (-) comp10133_c0_seq2:1122-1379(-)